MSVCQRILVALENSPYDAAILEYIRPFARVCGASLVLIHVADGYAAQHIHDLNLRESEEIRQDRAYLEKVAETLAGEGFAVESVLAGGDPANEIIAAAEREHCDLIAMSTHGHRWFKDLLFGSVAEAVRHRTTIPVLLVRGRSGGAQLTGRP
jgi:nucleotide-binding universal stress UspA family protein